MTDAPRKYTYYPGCSSQASAVHLDRSLRAIAPKLGVELEEIEDWNCCGASVGHIEGGTLPQTALSGRNLAKARQQGPQDVLTPCAACYLNTHGVNEKIKADVTTRKRVNQALEAGGLAYEGDLKVRHACEVLVNDVGLDKIKGQVTKPLAGLKVAGYVGCQTVRPFAGTESGGDYDTYDQPEFLDDFVRACGAEPVAYDSKTSCCGGSVSVYDPEKTLHLIKKIVQAAVDAGADVIATPCPLCQQNVEMYQAEINKTFGTNFDVPVVYYSQLMAVAFGLDGSKDAALDANMIAPLKLIDLAKKK
ncbi:MAG: heterodisulfide reductase [Alphaproteobacteria bacterium]|nr:heterodisulfide reductase [Alphaproteobacteria bacterium]